ncbi:MAG: transcription antitermination factor NusB [Peptoniphilaceae bacterium]|nr:transcription antitermination factor NusB [Peptoniphilaceae bacterium]MDY6085591.1 transcription antitermination factor NusB [Peptoniphilaceae bacterium]
MTEKSMRESALDVLLRVDEGEQVERALNRTDDALSDARTRADRRHLVYTVLERQRHLDYLLDRYAKKPMHAQKRVPRLLLRLGAADLLFRETPAHAAIYETVAVAGKRAPYAKGFINGILRSIERAGDAALVVDTGDVDLDFAIRASYPDWMVAYFEEALGTSARLVLEAGNLPSPLSLFVVPHRATREAVMAELEAECVRVRQSDLSPFALLVDGGPVTESAAFREGRLSIQSQPSQIAAWMAVEDFKAPRVLDLCAAPGSKSIAMAALAPGARILANDVVAEKRQYIEENARRMGLPIETAVHDGTVFEPLWAEAFDVVLVDAPCSGLGLVGRKPDLRWKRNPEDIPALQQIQVALLKQAGRYVKPGGRLVYSTCTYGRAENEDVMATVAANFVVEPFQGINRLHFTPLTEGADGFTMMRWRKLSGKTL